MMKSSVAARARVVRRDIRGLLLVLVLLLTAPMQAANTWTYASSTHFEVFTTAGARSARETLAQFERIRAFFAGHLELTPPAGRRVRLVLFSNEAEFRPYRINDAVVAFYRPGAATDYIVMHPLGRLSHDVMVHEYVHLILNRSGGRYPVWLNEGLAEYFATLPSTGDAVPVGRMARTRMRSLMSGRLFNLDQLFAVTHESPEYQTAEHGGLFYAQSWALTHMLLADPRYRDGANRFIALMREGIPSAQAVETVWGRPLGRLQGDLQDYVRNGYFAVRVIRFDEPSEDAPVATREVSSFEADLVLANMLAAAREDADKARKAFEGLAAQKPDDIALLESRAALEFRTGRARAGRPFLERAIELDTTTASTYRDLAALVVAEDAARAEALLERALALDPLDVRTRVHLASLLSRRDPVEVILMLEPVGRAGSAEAFDVFRLRANAYLAVNDLARAREAARELTQVARSRQQQAVAARVVSSVERRTRNDGATAMQEPPAGEAGP
jgi:tetratricopeptide (TPR) repeat protein